MYKVYWTEEFGAPCSQDYADLSAALNVCNNLRTAGMRYVTMVSEDPNLVGRSGADMVRGGKLPDGELYDWTKRDRVGAGRHQT
jgi:hypothetical protein